MLIGRIACNANGLEIDGSTVRRKNPGRYWASGGAGQSLLTCRGWRSERRTRTAGFADGRRQLEGPDTWLPLGAQLPHQ
jgi:hypothetical protein